VRRIGGAETSAILSRPSAACPVCTRSALGQNNRTGSVGHRTAAVGTDIWIALAWRVGVLTVAYIFAMFTYRRRISRPTLGRHALVEVIGATRSTQWFSAQVVSVSVMAASAATGVTAIPNTTPKIAL
jgi:hypothetical protein